MFDDYENKEVYSFNYEGVGGSISFTLREYEGITWPNILNRFVSFLEASGYVGVREKIRLENGPMATEAWDGEFFEYDYSDNEESDLDWGLMESDESEEDIPLDLDEPNK